MLIVPSPFQKSPTLWIAAFTLIAGMISRAGLPGTAKEDPRPTTTGTAVTEFGSPAEAARAAGVAETDGAVFCIAWLRVWKKTERLTVSKPTLKNKRVAVLNEKGFVVLAFIVFKSVGLT
jgi:hypothetical protein